jgi:hypothetical protein
MILRYYSSSAQRSTEKSLGNRGDGGGLTRASLAAVVRCEFCTVVAVKFGVRSIRLLSDRSEKTIEIGLRWLRSHRQHRTICGLLALDDEEGNKGAAKTLITVSRSQGVILIYRQSDQQEVGWWGGGEARCPR